MKIYVVRHGQTDWNVAGKCQGRTDIELNNTRIEQAKNTKGQLKNHNIDLIICSPLKRAIKTVEIINEETKCNIIIDENGHVQSAHKKNCEIREFEFKKIIKK